mmetsp:Transcript_23928/g.59641  ORF Transcript_23928/g.59641 Transcript_23928/m.59641 type:complete len:281 (+) Transcript_23928:790-1632(+)
MGRCAEDICNSAMLVRDEPNGFGVPHLRQAKFLSNWTSRQAKFGHIQSPFFATMLLLLTLGFGTPHCEHAKHPAAWGMPHSWHDQFSSCIWSLTIPIANTSGTCLRATSTGFGMPHLRHAKFRSNWTSWHIGLGQIQSPNFDVCLLLLTVGLGAPQSRHITRPQFCTSPHSLHFQSSTGFVGWVPSRVTPLATCMNTCGAALDNVTPTPTALSEANSDTLGVRMAGRKVPHFRHAAFFSNCTSLQFGLGQIQSPAFDTILLLLTVGFGAAHFRHTKFFSN